MEKVENIVLLTVFSISFGLLFSWILQFIYI